MTAAEALANSTAIIIVGLHVHYFAGAFEIVLLAEK